MRVIPVLFIALASLTASSQNVGVTVPRVPSPAATVSQTIGISTVTVDYSRPSVKGRAIWGALVPYGWNKEAFGAGNEAPWRSGANENTVIRFSHAATVEGQAVSAGKYGLFFVINKDNTGEVILSKDSRSWGNFWYDPQHDLLRAKIAVRDMPSSTEQLTYDFAVMDKNSAELDLNWEKKQFPVKIAFNVDDIVMDNAVEELKGTTGFNWQGYTSAADYALQNKTHYEQAIGLIDRAIAMNSNFTDLNVKAGLLAAMGKTAESDKVRNDALDVATENELNLYAYQLLGQGESARAISAFLLNTKRHPASANVWDSLGEGYALSGDTKNAIASFKKSLSMNPPANVRANSEKYLKKLGAM